MQVVKDEVVIVLREILIQCPYYQSLILHVSIVFNGLYFPPAM